MTLREIIKLAKKVGADAIHPGYGFLSENVNFVKRCQEEGIIFVGPEPEVMDRLGDKVSAKKIARACEVPLIEDNQKKLTDIKIVKSEAKNIGFPIMIKAVAGGGGRGMRVVRSEDELELLFNEAKGEAVRAFGDGTMFMEKFVRQTETYRSTNHGGQLRQPGSPF